MMDERKEEQASLHVLGALGDAEAREFKQAMQADPELQKFVSRLSTATGAMAGAVPAAEPPPQLRAKILDQVAPRQKIVALPERKAGSLSWLSWALAAGFAVLCTVLQVQDAKLRTTIAGQAQQFEQLDKLAQSLQSATNSLQKALVALQETNRLENLRIAMLNSMLADSPKAVAVGLWDEKEQRGVFVAQNLKPLPADKDYQLWVIDPKYSAPVSAGVFQVDGQGGGRLQFKADRPIETAGKFAVTQEPKGGLPTPTLKNLVLIGG